MKIIKLIFSVILNVSFIVLDLFPLQQLMLPFVLSQKYIYFHHKVLLHTKLIWRDDIGIVLEMFGDQKLDSFM